MIGNIGGQKTITGDTLTVTTPGAGITVTAAKDGKTKTKVSGADGVAVFKGLASGDWTVTMTDGSQTAQKTVSVTTDYSAEITFFSATIHVTYPAGSVCTATDGVTTLTAPDTGGTWACVVPNAGTWTVSLDSGFNERVSITQNEQTEIISKWHLLYADDMCTDVTGGWIADATAMYDSVIKKAPTVTKNSDNVEVVLSGNEVSGCYRTKNKVDITGFSTLSIDAVGYAYNGLSYFYLMRDLSIYKNAVASVTLFHSGSFNGTASIDLTSVPGGEYYVFVGVSNYNDSAPLNIKISRVMIGR